MTAGTPPDDGPMTAGTRPDDGPPRDLDDDLEVAPGDWSVRELYLLLTGLVVPRPVAWVSTLAADGTRNLAPHSYFNLVAHDPPHVMIGSSGRKDTLTNIEATDEFVVNVTTEHVLEAMNATAVDAPPEVDEFALVGVTPAPSRTVAPPRVAEALAHLECRLAQVVPVGGGHLVLGAVTHVHVDRRVWRDGRVDPALLQPVLRLAGSQYATLGELVRLPRPGWADDVAGHADGDRTWVPRRP